MFDNIFANKNVFLTGHTGFKGSWLAAWLTRLGAKVTGYALLPTCPESHFELIHLADRMTHITGDILDFPSLNQAIQKTKPEFIFHLAAQALVRDAYDDPRNTFNTNILGSVNVLEASRHCDSLRSLVYITSDKCYRNVEWGWGYRENDVLGGKDPYSASKGCAELVFNSYYLSYFQHIPNLRAASVRAGNVIGGGDWAKDRLIPDCIRSLRKNQKIIIRNPRSTRPWQHVLEPLGGYLQLAYLLYTQQEMMHPPSYNIGPEKFSNKKVEEVVKEVITLWGSGEMNVEKSENAPREDNLLQLNCDLAYRYLHWMPIWDFHDCLRETIYWYKRYQAGDDVYTLTEKQIEKYETAWKTRHV